MARSITLKQFRTRLENLTGIENDSSFTVEEKNDIIASAVAETIDHIISSGLSEQTVKTASFNTVSGQLEYDMDSVSYIPDQDFYKVSKVFVDEGGGQLRPIERINLGDVQAFRPPQSASPITIHYIPFATNFKDSATGEYNDDATFDGINGWEEHSLMTAAVSVKRKKEDDYRPFQQRKEQLEGRMAFLGNTDFSGPARVVQRRRRQRINAYLPYQQQISAWAIRNKKLCLYYAYPWVP